MLKRSRSVMSLLALAFGIVFASATAHAAESDIVLYASDVSTVQGNWAKVSATGAAGGQQMASSDKGWSVTDAPLPSPADYFEITFSAPSYTTYHVWLRLRASANTKWNDSVWVQFNDAMTTNGSAAYRTGTASGLIANLEPCKDCGVNGWGWQDKGYWVAQSPLIMFGASGSHTLRVQTREDGVQVDQIVLSPANYLSTAPGQASGDSTIIAKPAVSSSPSGSTPYSGSAVSVPGVVQAENFDNGNDGVAYHDTSAGNSGNAYRSTGVDIENASSGGYDVGWTDAGEWLNYSVNVAAAGSYTVDVRVASSGQGGSFHLEMNGVNVTGSMTVPNTGGWQNWQTLSKTVSLAAGAQVMRLAMDATGAAALGNFDSITFTASAPSTPPTGSGPAAPNSPNVLTGTAGVTVTPTLSWKAAGATSYDLLVGTANPPGMYVSNISTYWYSTTTPLAGGTLYYWQVVAKNATGSTPGPVWSFTTAGSPSVPPPPPPPPPPTGGAGSTFRVMTWNIQHGTTKAGVYDVVSQAQFIASQNPDVVLLQEVQTWDEDQPQRYKTLLQQFTGQTWSVVWAPVINTASTEGNVILTRLPVVSSTYYQMHATGNYTEMYANRSVAQATVKVGTIPVNVFATHLDYYNTAYRTIQEQQMMAWLPNFGGTRIVGGDFNSWWGEQWITTMQTQHSDTWQDYTGSNQNGYTVNSAVRFDYIFRAFDSNTHATPTNCFVPATALSDHYPVVADFKVQ